ncbi:hypothetical protein K490DRAFT_56036 [Saccharata proteae CBS 121410]|uniref:Uncharacterized protein n=1 Tax=Saccharata proteae CBS 121410 TaxID=1314787 RepID=A0A9P4HZD0_9PEZI|nr:hypothetical protein K490DRAFT_56036 [Saccharata proteae CBS 121410]
MARSKSSKRTCVGPSPLRMAIPANNHVEDNDQDNYGDIWEQAFEETSSSNKLPSSSPPRCSKITRSPDQWMRTIIGRTHAMYTTALGKQMYRTFALLNSHQQTYDSDLLATEVITLVHLVSGTALDVVARSMYTPNDAADDEAANDADDELGEEEEPATIDPTLLPSNSSAPESTTNADGDPYGLYHDILPARPRSPKPTPSTTYDPFSVVDGDEYLVYGPSAPVPESGPAYEPVPEEIYDSITFDDDASLDLANVPLSSTSTTTTASASGSGSTSSADEERPCSGFAASSTAHEEFLMQRRLDKWLNGPDAPTTVPFPGRRW